MIKLVITGAVVFVVSLAAGAGITVMKAPPPKPAAADSTVARADSARAGRDSLLAVQPPPDAHAAAAAKPAAPETAAHAAPENPARATPESARSTAAAAPAAPPAHAVPAPVAALAASAGDDEGYKQVARVLSNMKPADAAKILAYLTDDQVEGILRQLGVRQAASLMSVLPVERAAAMSRRMIQHPPEPKP